MSWGGVRLLFRRSSSLLPRHLGDLLVCPRGADVQAARLALRSVALARRRAARCDLRCSFARWPVFFAVHFLLVVEALVRVPGFSWAGDRGHFWRRFALLLTFVLFVGPLFVLLVFMFSPFLGPWFVCRCDLFVIAVVAVGAVLSKGRCRCRKPGPPWLFCCSGRWMGRRPSSSRGPSPA